MPVRSKDTEYTPLDYFKEEKCRRRKHAERHISRVIDVSMPYIDVMRKMSTGELNALTKIREAELKKQKLSKGSYKAKSTKECFEEYIYIEQHKIRVKLKPKYYELLKEEAAKRSIRGCIWTVPELLDIIINWWLKAKKIKILKNPYEELIEKEKLEANSIVLPE